MLRDGTTPAPGPASTPVSATRGECGVSVMPRDRVVVTAGSAFLVLTEAQAWDLQTALAEVRSKLNRRRP